MQNAGTTDTILITGRYECHEAEDVAKRVMARIREQKRMPLKKRRAEVSVLLFFVVNQH